MVEWVKHLGDGQLAVFESPEEAIRFADSFRDELRGTGLDIRAGMHAGSNIAFVDLGSRRLRGLEGEWQLLPSRTRENLMNAPTSFPTASTAS